LKFNENQLRIEPRDGYLKALFRLVILFLISILALNCSLFGSEQAEFEEKLGYRIKILGFITIGYAEMSTSQPTKKYERDVLILKARTWTTEFISTFHPVDDRIIAYWDLIKQRTLWSQKQILHGSFKRQYEAKFDFESRNLFWEQQGYPKNETGGQKEGVLAKIPPDFMDMLSAVYYSRITPETGTPGSTYLIDLFDDLKKTTLKMEIIRKEEIEVEINDQTRRIPSLVVKPFYQTTGLFHSKGDLTMWISDDFHHWPLRISANVALGTAEAELFEVK